MFSWCVQLYERKSWFWFLLPAYVLYKQFVTAGLISYNNYKITDIKLAKSKSRDNIDGSSKTFKQLLI